MGVFLEVRSSILRRIFPRLVSSFNFFFNFSFFLLAGDSAFSIFYFFILNNLSTEREMLKILSLDSGFTVVLIPFVGYGSQTG
jgi:hypothetical protein